MKSIRFILATVLLAMLPLISFAQKDTYLYTKALESFQYDDYKTAQAYAVRELKVHPKNAYAWLLNALCNAINNGEEGSSLSALDNAIRFMPATDTDGLLGCYQTKIKLYEDIDAEKIPAIYEEALKRLPKSIKLLAKRAEYYAEQDKYGLARKDYERVLKLDAYNAGAMVSMGDLYLAEENYPEALGWYRRATESDSLNAEAKYGNVQAYYAMEDYGKAIDAILDLETEEGELMTSYLYKMADTISTKDLVEQKIKAREVAEPSNPRWPKLLAEVYTYQGNYAAALKAYEKIYEQEPSARNAALISAQHFSLNKYDDAVRWMNKAMELAKDSADASEMPVDYYLSQRANIYLDKGDYDLAVRDYTTLLKNAYDDETTRLGRGYAYVLQGKYKEAMDDFNAAIGNSAETGETLDPNLYLFRGWLNLKDGKIVEAKGDFRKAVEADSVGTPYKATFISQHFLGIDKTAMESAERSVSEDGGAMNCFDVACLYALMDDKAMAVRKLEIAIEKNFNSWTILHNHPWMENLKGYADYEKLLKAHPIVK